MPFPEPGWYYDSDSSDYSSDEYSPSDRLNDSFARIAVRDRGTATRSPPPLAHQGPTNATYEYESSYRSASGSTIRENVKVTYNTHVESAHESSRATRDGASRRTTIHEERSSPSRHPSRHEDRTRDRSYSHTKPPPKTESSRYDRGDSRATGSKYDGGRTATDSRHGESHRSSRYDDHGSSSRHHTSTRDSHYSSKTAKDSHHGDSRRDSHYSSKTAKDSRHGDSRRSSHYDDRGSSSRHQSSARDSHYSSTRRDDKTRGGERTRLSTVAEAPFVDYYEVLGVPYRATMDEVKKAARQKRVETHPDKLIKSGMSDREIRKIKEKAARVGQAADVLSDESSRRVYNAERREMGY